jgi:hypothetical protein
MRNVFLSLLILFGFMQCTEPCDTCGDGKIMENYVLKYYKHTDYSYLFVDIPVKDSSGIKFQSCFYNGELINSIFPLDDNMLVKFREIAKYNGDTAYYRHISQCFPYTCLAHEIGRFDISCNKEYAGYSAGTSLNDMFTICYYSAEEFIRNGYDVNQDIKASTVKQYCKPLTEFNTGTHHLVASNHIYLILNVNPDYSAEYMFTFTYSDSLVKIVSGSYLLYDIE